MSWRVDGRVLKQNGRAKSVEKSAKLPPAITQESRERTEALRKAYNRPKTAFRNTRPETGNNSSLPGFVGRSSSAKRGNTSSAKHMARSQSESRNLLKLVDYGRSPSKEKLNDLKDELYEAKKKMMTMEIERKKIQTQMHRVLRDSEKREKYLERLVTSKFQPAEMNDTHMARTLTAIQRNEINREQIIRMQAKELEELKKSIAESRSLEVQASSSNENEEESDYASDDSDYPEEPDQLKTNGVVKRDIKEPSKLENNNNPPSPSIEVVKNAKEKEKEKLMHAEKMRKKIEIAKAYADQNARLKERLKELKQNYLSAQQKNKEKEENFRSHHQQENQKAAIHSQELLTTMEKLKSENASLKDEKVATKEQIEELNQELREAYGEIDALKMENEHLNDLIIDLESRFGKSLKNPNNDLTKEGIHIPKLNMTLIDSREEGSAMSGSSSRSVASVTHIDQGALATALAEILGAHAERICIESRTN